MLHVPFELTDGGRLLRCLIRKMSLGGVWGSGATYGFVQGAGVTSFIPFAEVGSTSQWGAQARMGCTYLDRDK